MLILSLLALQVSVLTDKPPRRLDVTAEHLATAFKDPQAKSLFDRARTARLKQDSSLRNYDATVRERAAVGLSIGENGRERALYRYETAARVQWQRDVGAWIDLTGARVGIPVAPQKAEREALIDAIVGGEFGTVPYFPGQESLWLGGTVGNNEIDDRRVVNPLAQGAEAYYTYETGDSVEYTLPDGKTVQLRELKVRPRSAVWNVAVGSLQFDIATGQVVAAIYRLAAPQNVLQSIGEAIDDTAKAAKRAFGVVKFFAPTMQSQFSEVIVEYALHESRFWLPRLRTFKGSIQFGPAMMPATVTQAFMYNSVNGRDTLPPIVLNAPDRGLTAPDSLSRADRRKWFDSVGRANRVVDSAFRMAVRDNVCDSTGVRTRGRYYRQANLAVAVRSVCDLEQLANSPDISKSLYSPDDSLFRRGDLDALVDRALGFNAQAAFNLFSLPKAHWKYGLSMSRYNRVEGLSTGLRIEQQFGGGYSAALTGRLGFADAKPNLELALARTNGSSTFALGGYHRLVAANDWGNPLSFNASLAALFFGRDDGFYYRASGAELTYKSGGLRGVTLRMFAENQREATQEAKFSIGGDFPANMTATRVTSLGAALRISGDYGEDPRGFRLFTDLRLEGAGGDSSYGRGSLELTLSRTMFANFAGALTVAGGSSVGGVTPQRRWYLGGVHTIRGQRPDTAQTGNAFGMARVELGRDFRTHRWSVFTDIGWVGDRTQTSDIGKPMSGVGVGMSMFDGLIRLDFARGIYPRDKFRVDFTLGSRW